MTFLDVELLKKLMPSAREMKRVAKAGPPLLTPRWYPLRPHELQRQVWESKARFIVNPAGRRSGKTELLKRKTVTCAIAECKWHDAWFVLGAPTVAQARRIFWKDIIELCPKKLVRKKNETEMIIRLYNGAEIQVMGLEKPERIEGRPLNGIGIDEYANIREEAWDNNIRPALADREGWAHFIGVPEGRGHYWELFRMAMKGDDPDWAGYTWTSKNILSDKEIESMRRRMDPRTFDQEVNAAFISFEGRVYYTFSEANVLSGEAKAQFKYNDLRPLILMFDFNVSPGVCAIAQEHDVLGTVIFDEIWIQSDSNSDLIAREVIRRYGSHRGKFELYGDATGGARGSAKVDGSDWEIIEKRMCAALGSGRVFKYVPRANPPERARVNAMCSRIMSADGARHLWVMDNCERVVIDLDGVVYSDGTNEIEKDKNPTLSHISDAIGYYVVYRFPLRGDHVTVVSPY